MQQTVVIGLGNPLMGDEGIGTAVIEALVASADQCPDVDFIDGGTGGMNLLHIIAGRRRAIIIDCALMGEKPGTIRRFVPEDVATVKKLTHLSLHEVDILKVIEIGRQLGQCPEEIIFFGIEPEKIHQTMELGPTLSARLNQYIRAVKQELN